MYMLPLAVTLSIYYGNCTCIFGPITEEAIKRFQQAYKLNIDGVVRSATLAKLPPLNPDGEQTSKKQLIQIS
jgi:peptidoglycan hydrolase-like protein with peptidoglycan-binding domain